MVLTMVYLYADLALKDYSGGTNPLLVYLFFSLITLFITGSLGIVAWKIYKRLKFHRICSSAGLDGEESGLIQSFIRLFHIADPLRVLQKKSHYDFFANQVGHHFGNMEISAEDLQHEISVFNSIREKLGFQHDFNLRKLVSSRALPEGVQLVVTFYDRETKNYMSFQSKVIENNDLFMGIAMPSDDMKEDLMKIRKASLEISFVRARDAEYHFESRIFCEVTKKTTFLYVSHARTLTRGNVYNPLNIPATIMYYDAAGVKEHKIVIEVINNKNCVIYPIDESVIFHKKASALINFSVQGAGMSLQGKIAQIILRGEKRLYRMEFNDVADDIKRILLRLAARGEVQERKTESEATK
jgi:hypothetical protein